MKKLLLMIVLMLMMVSGAKAQNANRSGFYVELQGGAALGEVLHYTVDYDNVMSRLKGGFVGSFDFGYRWAFSKHFALGGKVGLWSDFAEFGKTYQLRAMPGVRWTSRDFGTGSKSAFIEFNTGIGVVPGMATYVPFELSAGINFTQNLYGGIVFDYSLSVGDDSKRDGYLYEYYEYKGYFSTDSGFRLKPIHVAASSYPSLALRLGYRF